MPMQTFFSRHNVVLMILLFMFFAQCKSTESNKKTKKRRTHHTSASAHLYGSSKKKSSPARAKAPTRSASAKTTPAAPTAPLAPTAASVIQTARSFQGVPYKLGGTTRLGMDCSGLVFTAFRSIDREVPRVSHQQPQVGRPVRQQELQPGDLVFFNTKRGKGINHVGIVTEVRPDAVKFIHASTSLGVVESDLYTDYYRRAYVKAVRPDY